MPAARGLRGWLGLAGGPSAAAKAYYNSVLRRLPVEPGLVVFESMMGTQFSDSPRAVYEELLRQEPRARAVWSVRRGVAVPAGVHAVRRWSPQWYRALATAAVWVDNQGFPGDLRKPRGTTYVQTWHGTPLKRMGWDDPTLDPQRAAGLQRAVDRWDVVTVPSDYFGQTIVDAYRSRAARLLVGMPRNDVLVRPMTTGERGRRLAGLGLRPDLRTILYAPTRKGTDSGGALPPGPWSALPGPESGWQVLNRSHYRDAMDAAAAVPAHVRDVTGVGDMADLLAIADVLVTDYSSSMFDFCLTDRPVVLYQPDQAEYFAARGICFDVREFAPGPITTTPDELAEVLRTVDRWRDDWSEHRAEYRARFGQYETGEAASAVVREVIVPRLRR